MKDGFIKVAAVAPKIKVCDVDSNVEAIIDSIKLMHEKGARIIAFPELGITGATCADMYMQSSLIIAARQGLGRITEATQGLNTLVFVGVPIEVDGELLDAAAALYDGKLIGLTTRKSFDKRDMMNLTRYFAGAGGKISSVLPMYPIEGVFGLKVGVCIGDDIYGNAYDFARCAKNGANLIVCMDAHPELITSEEDIATRLKALSDQFACNILYVNAGEGESTTDFVFSGRTILVECGQVVAMSEAFTGNCLCADLDCSKAIHERVLHASVGAGKKSSACNDAPDTVTPTIPLVIEEETLLTRHFAKNPFVPEDENVLAKRCERILLMQAMGLKKRVEHTKVETVVMGISGGLDSTLALLVCAKAFDLAKIDRQKIIAVTMPGFGTTGRTKNNAVTLVKALGITLREVNIEASVRQHFADIGHDENDRNVTYENCQARERTQVLMDIANDTAGLVVGTGDLSELALGWATYNGDHMSMYGVNSGIPKTMLRHLVAYYANNCGNDIVRNTLIDILNTPVSPELLPPKDGEIAQCTEELVGPYELHDFFLYYMLRWGYSPKKIFRIAKIALPEYDSATILKWEKKFYWRFFSSQFKRSCLADGVKIGSVGIGPRGDLCMPSDAVCEVWIKELEEM